MIKLIGGGVGILFAAILALGSCEVIDTGNVGVKTTAGQVDLQEVMPGFTFKAPMITGITEYNVKEASLDLGDLTPKARDNLSLKDLDVSIFYEVEPSKVADIVAGYQGQTLYSEESGAWYPGQGIVVRFAREAIYDAVSKMDSLTIHQRREALVQEIRINLQRKLDKFTPNTFRVTNLVVRAITTDPSIENSIQLAVQAQKDLERKGSELKAAEADAQIALTRAEGEAAANRALNASLTPELLRKMQIDSMEKFARNGNATVVLPSGATPLINVGN
jgi:regulator of protease activity HflC (stomatin/prohibitin superfamily)